MASAASPRSMRTGEPPLTHPHAPHPPLPQSRICPRMLADVLSPPLRCRQMKGPSLLERLHPGGARSSSSKLVYSIDELATSCGAALGSASLPPPPLPLRCCSPPAPPIPRATASRELRGPDIAHSCASGTGAVGGRACRLRHVMCLPDTVVCAAVLVAGLTLLCVRRLRWQARF